MSYSRKTGGRFTPIGVLPHVTILTKIDGNGLSPRYGIVDAGIGDHPDQLVFHKIISYLIASWDISCPGGFCPESGPLLACSITILLGTLLTIDTWQMCSPVYFTVAVSEVVSSYSDNHSQSLVPRPMYSPHQLPPNGMGALISSSPF